MKIIHLVEQDIVSAVKEYAKLKLEATEIIGTIKFHTGVRGNYDRGTAEEYVKSADLEIKNNDEL